MDRREFIKKAGFFAVVIGAGATAGSWIFGRVLAAVEETSTIHGRSKHWIMVVDIEKCTGCKACVTACNEMHWVPSNQEWIRIYEEENALGGKYFLPRTCQHCEKAPCVDVCPVKATYHNDQGLVVIDNKKCVGCRLCMAACPYQARYFNWGEPDNNPPPDIAAKHSPENAIFHVKGTVEKCDFCGHLANERLLPACVVGCPENALYFGDLFDDAVSNMTETISLTEILNTRQAYKLKEELGTEPSVYYLPK